MRTHRAGDIIMAQQHTDQRSSNRVRGADYNRYATAGDQLEQEGGLRKGLLGFMLGHEQFPVEQLLEYGARAEQAGFDLVAASDHLQPWQENEGHCGAAWATLAALSQRTQHVWMGTTVTCPTLRYHPAVVAEMFASLSRLSPGRLFLGLGSGEALNEQAATGEWPAWSERWERLAEAVQIIRELWRGEAVRHGGNYYKVDMKLYDPPAQPIPILLAANGPKAMRRAGQHGDGLITDPQTWKEHKGEFESAARVAGKDPAAMPVLMEMFVVVGGESVAKTAAELWRFIPKAFKGYHDIRDPQQIQERAEAEIPLEQVYDQWLISADPEQHLQKITELFQSGATIVNIHSGQPDQQHVIEFYGRQVIPQLPQRLQLAARPRQ
jgi:F420-dependent hydroxymycolic acid dehydrogenase